MAESKILNYINRFKESYDGSPWYGEAIEAQLKDVSDVNAFIQPNQIAHSIAELVKHMIYWRQPLIKLLEGDRSFKPSVESPDNWIGVDKLKEIG